MISQSELRAAVKYDHDTGIFTWVKPISKKCQPGDRLGTVDHTGYVRLHVYRHKGQAHRLAWLYMYGVMPEGQIDHINGNRQDNRISNLRVVSNQENSRNQRIAKNNKYGIIGVYLRPERGYWYAFINDGGRINLGKFKTLLDAACARRSAEIRHGFHANHGRAVQ